MRLLVALVRVVAVAGLLYVLLASELRLAREDADLQAAELNRSTTRVRRRRGR